MALLAAVLAMLGAFTVSTTTASAAPDPNQKIDQQVTSALDAKDSADFWVVFNQQADLSGASAISDWAQRGQAVVDALKSTADTTQGAVKADLDTRKVSYQSFWAANAIRVTGGTTELAQSLAGRGEVRSISATHTYALPTPTPAADEAKVNAVEWGIAAINADDAWSTFGARGEGIVVANIDTGTQFDHPALVNKYRGNLGGGSFDHNHNWFDPSNVCPGDVPCDNNGHGTHTMGTMVGDDGGANQVGVAPGAKFIAAKGCESNSCSDAALLGSGQWILAPTDLAGANPRADLRPNIVNNSWGGGGGDFWYQATVNAWRASGIFPAFSNGNSGPSCDTAGSPGDYTNSYASGAFDINGAIASFSSRGPGEANGLKPNLAAPGVAVRSSVPGGGYSSFNGTSMASPHTAGTVALMWSAAPSLLGNLAQTETLLDGTATDTSNLTCGGTAADNNVWGEGKLNAFAAVDQSPRGPVGTLTGVVTDAANGNPLAGATVAITGPSNRSLTTGTDGRYSTTLPVGAYTATANKFGYGEGTGSASVTEGATTTLNFSLSIVTSGTVSGVVRNAANAPVANATVEVLGTPIAPVVTGADGTYSIPNVPLGSYQVKASAGTCNTPQTQALTVDGNETLDFTLPNRTDAFGYYCVLEGASYVEAETPVALIGDDAATSVALPFPFFYYGATYTQAFLSTNGHINFAAASTAFSNVAIPAAGAPNAAIYPFWDDLRLDATSSVKTKVSGAAPNREFVIEYRNAGFFTGTERIDFETVLAESGEISFRYRNLSPAAGRETGNSATVGIENANGTVAFQYSLNTSVLSDAQSIRFKLPPNGTVTGTVTDFNDSLPVAGATVTAKQGTATVATVTTGADGTYSMRLLAGAYTVEVGKSLYTTDTGSVTVTDGGTATRDVALHTPRAELTGGPLRFLAQAGQLRTGTLILASTGDLTLDFSLASDSSWLWAVPGSSSVQPGTQRAITVRVDPDGLRPGVHTGNVTLTTNAGRTPSIVVPVTLVVPAYRIGIDAGSTALYTDSASDFWDADTAWTPGSIGYVGPGFVETSKQAIAGTTDDKLYQSARTGAASYRFDGLPAGVYTVELDFAEIKNQAAGRRVFDVSINGQVVLPGYDIAAAVGMLTADRRTFQVAINEGGQIDVSFGARAKKQPPTVSGVRVTHRPDL